MKRLPTRLLPEHLHAFFSDTHAGMAFFEAMCLTVALLIFLVAAHPSPSVIRMAGLIEGVCFAVLMAISSYSSFVQWYRPQPPLSESQLQQAIQYLTDLGLPEHLSRDMVNQQWEEEKEFFQHTPAISDNKLLHQLARKEAFYTLCACLAGSALIVGCYWIAPPSLAAWLSIALSFLLCIILQMRTTTDLVLRWSLLLFFVSGASSLAGHIFHGVI